MDIAPQSGGNMNDKNASVNMHLADTGEFVINRSWREGEGDKQRYKDQELIFDKLPSEVEIRKMFRKGEYKRTGSLRADVENASDEIENSENE